MGFNFRAAHFIHIARFCISGPPASRSRRAHATTPLAATRASDRPSEDAFHIMSYRFPTDFHRQWRRCRIAKYAFFVSSARPRHARTIRARTLLGLLGCGTKKADARIGYLLNAAHRLPLTCLPQLKPRPPPPEIFPRRQQCHQTAQRHARAQILTHLPSPCTADFRAK